MSRRVWSIIAVLICSVSLFGCKTAPVNSQAAKNQQTTKLTRAQKAERCYYQAKNSVAGQIVSREVIFADNDESSRFSLMDNQKRPTISQKEALKAFLADSEQCRKDAVISLRGTPYEFILQRYYGDLDSIYAKLLSGQVTIGQANIEKSNLVNQFKTEMGNARAERTRQVAQQRKGNEQARMAYFIIQGILQAQREQNRHKELQAVFKR